MVYEGNREQLLDAISSFSEIAEMKDVNANLVQIRTQEGLMVNWHPKQKRVHLQGKKAQVSRLDAHLSSCMSALALQGKPIEVGSPKEGTSDKALAYKRRSAQEARPLEYVPDRDSELVIALVGAVGTDLSVITTVLTERLKSFNYETSEIKISNDIIAELKQIPEKPYFARVSELMTQGNALRETTKDFSVLAKLAAAKVNEKRQAGIPRGEELKPMPRRAFIISSLKHPEEVAALRKIYANGFFLIGVHANKDTRHDYLHRNKGVQPQEIEDLFERDQDEAAKHGQHTRDTYHLSDFFVDFGDNRNKFEKDVWRVLDLVFGKPFVTPTFDEFAMFMAFSASLRSADLSRQVGAVVTKNDAIVSTGANDVPRHGGGLYWPDYYGGTEIHDIENGRDYARAGDTNVLERNDIIADILTKFPEDERSKVKDILLSSKLKNITEYGRVMHAEMEAILSCSRGSVGTKGAQLYCTTFPCHNCAKHIIASGITKVVYVEPYPKSKASDFHGDSITLNPAEKDKVLFQPFVGVGPRSFFNLFSVNLGTGYEVTRKNGDGKPVDWKPDDATLRMQMLPTSYIERESITTNYVNRLLEKTS